MQKAINIIKLVCFASKDCQESVVGPLQQLGNTLSLIDSNCWLEGQIKEPNSLIILILPEKNLLADKIVKAILATPNSQYLVIFFPPLTDEISPILNVCSDCCRWPCDPLELAFRLGRLSSKHFNPFDLSKFDMETAAWKNLNLPKSRTLHAAHASSVVMAESASKTVLIVPSVTLSQPWGHIP